MTSVFTAANLLTTLRLILIPIFVSAVCYQRFLPALAIFFAAALTDGLDGLVARTFNQRTPLGEILDPLADKLLLITAFITLSLPGHSLLSPLPFWLTASVISRDIFIVIGAVVIRLTTGWSRFPPSIPGKLNTLVQVLTIVIFLTANVLHLQYPDLDFERWLPIIYYPTLAMAIISGLHYIHHVKRQMQRSAQTIDQTADRKEFAAQR